MTTYCISLDPNADDYVADIVGRNNFTVIALMAYKYPMDRNPDIKYGQIRAVLPQKNSTTLGFVGQGQ